MGSILQPKHSSTFNANKRNTNKRNHKDRTMSIDLHTEALLQRLEDYAAELDERAADSNKDPLTYEEVTHTISRYVEDYRFYKEGE